VVFKDVLVPALIKRYGAAAFRGGTHDPIIFPAVHPDVGELRINDNTSPGEVEEAIVFIGRHAHGHFFASRKDRQAEQDRDVSRQVMHCLELLFSDRLLIISSESGAGGFEEVSENNEEEGKVTWEDILKDELGIDDFKYYLWSGPVDPSTRH